MAKEDTGQLKAQDDAVAGLDEAAAAADAPEADTPESAESAELPAEQSSAPAEQPLQNAVSLPALSPSSQAGAATPSTCWAMSSST